MSSQLQADSSTDNTNAPRMLLGCLPPTIMFSGGLVALGLVVGDMRGERDFTASLTGVVSSVLTAPSTQFY